jgi:hypothetical protein
MNRRSGTIMVIATLVLATFGTVTMAADSNIGTWKMNPAKSKYSPDPAPKSQTLKIEAWGADGVSYVADGVSADGKPMHWAFQAKYDGKFMPFTGNPDMDMISYKRVDANTVASATQLRGKPAMTSKAVVSADGKTRTLTQTGKNAKGQDISNVVVYDRQ